MYTRAGECDCSKGSEKGEQLLFVTRIECTNLSTAFLRSISSSLVKQIYTIRSDNLFALMSPTMFHATTLKYTQSSERNVQIKSEQLKPRRFPPPIGKFGGKQA